MEFSAAGDVYPSDKAVGPAFMGYPVVLVDGDETMTAVNYRDRGDDIYPVG